MSEAEEKRAKSKNGRAWIGASVEVAIALYLLMQLKNAVADGKYPLSALLAGLVTIFVIQIPAWLPRRPFAPRAFSGPPGTIFRPDRRINLLSGATVLISFVVLGAWAILGKMGIVTDPSFIGEFAGGFLLMCGVPAVVCAVFIGLMIRRRGAGYIQLTPEGFVFSEGILGTRGRWSEVVDMSDVHPRRPISPDAITLVAADGRTATVQRAGFYVADGEALRKLIRFYWQHPDQRAELTDGRSLERLRDELQGA